MARHVHADVMVAWANDSSLEIEYRAKVYSGSPPPWTLNPCPQFVPSCEYRIKPKPLPIQEISVCLVHTCDGVGQPVWVTSRLENKPNLKTTWQGNTLLKAEVI